MDYLANTHSLVADGVISQQQADEIILRSKDRLSALAINTLLLGGIITATFGLIFWLEAPLPVAIFGIVALISGSAILRLLSSNFGIFGNAAVLIGTGMMLGGSGIELVKRLDLAAAPYLFGMGALVLAATLFMWRRTVASPFVIGPILLMGLALHLIGLGSFQPEGALLQMAYAYAAITIFSVGLILDIRFISVFAILPLAQMLDVSTDYWHAVYAFYSPETTLSLVQMALVVVVCGWASVKLTERYGRHFGMLMVLGFITMNMNFLVGSLWGDYVGETIWGAGRWTSEKYSDYAAYKDATDAFRATAIHISADMYAIIWAVFLACMAIYAALNTKRGLLNVTLTFGAIHAYTQAFENFGAEPLVFAVGGLLAIPLAWGLLQLNNRLKANEAD